MLLGDAVSLISLSDKDELLRVATAEGAGACSAQGAVSEGSPGQGDFVCIASNSMVEFGVCVCQTMTSCSLHAAGGGEGAGAGGSHLKGAPAAAGPLLVSFGLQR